MSNINLPDNAGKVDTFTRTEGADTVHMQAVVSVDPTTGLPIQPLTDAQLRASAVPVSGTVTLDAATLNALETINANTGLTQPLTDTQLRASAVLTTNNDIGSIADASASSDNGTFSLISLFKRLLGKIPNLGQATMDASQPVVIASNQSAVPVSGTVDLSSASLSALENITVTVSNPTATGLTDTQLRASAVPVSVSSIPSHPVTNAGTFAVQVTSAPTTAVTGPLTDAQLRATAVPVSGTVTANTGLTQPLTDAQLRATAVPVSGTVTANTGLTQPLTDGQLRASPVSVSGTINSGAPAYSSVTIMSATTDSAGTGWVDFATQACSALDIVNASNTTIEYRRNGAGVGMPIPARSSREAVGITNADQISVRRVDQLTDQVTVYAEAMQ